MFCVKKLNDLTFPVELIVKLKNAIITSVDVERNFSIFKYLFSDRRQISTRKL